MIFRRKTAADGGRKRLPLWARIVLMVMLVLLLGIIGVNIYLKTTVNNRLRAIVTESSHGLYKLDYSGVSLNAITGSLTLRGVRLTPDQAVLNRLLKAGTAPELVYQGTAASIALNNVRWLVYLNTKKLNIGKIRLSQPRLNITRYKRTNDTANNTSEKSDFAKQVRDLRVAKFAVENAMLNYLVNDSLDAKRMVNIVEGLSLELEDLRIKKSLNGKPELEIDEHQITLRHFQHRTADNFYLLGIRGLDYNSKSRKASLAVFYAQPRYSEKEFARRQASQQTRYEVGFHGLSATGLDIQALLLKGEAILEKVSIKSGSIQMYMDRTRPSRQRDDGQVVISEKIKKIAFPFAVDSLAIGKMDVSYTEFNPATGQPARIPFESLAVTATNLTNLPGHIQRNSQLKIDAAGRFINAEIKADFVFDLASTEGKFQSTLVAGEIPAADLSPILTAIAKIETRKGTLEKLDAVVTGNEQGAMADVTLRYRGLKISMLKKEGDTMKRRGLPTMLANLFVVDDNPKDGVLRTAKSMRLVRRPGRSFFSMLWGAISLGIKDIITDKKAYKLDAV